ncbi:MAG: tetratricopeptide repeat protein [Candidatus Methylopumilus sp.]
MSAKKPPFNPDQLYQRALTLHHAGKLDDAESLYKTLLSYFPQQVEILTTLGILLLQQGRSEAGFQQLKKSLSIQANQPAALYNMAVELQKLTRLDEALVCYNQTLKLNPRDINALINRGNTLKDLKQYQAAIASFESALALQPNIPSAHWNKALTHILLGEYAQGWQEYEWGWQCGERGEPRKYTQPTWLGDTPIAGKSLLIHPEQGFGDLIQFSRYVPMLEKLGAKVILEAPASLVDLMASLSPTVTVIRAGEPLPQFDMVCPVMSLPLAFKTSVQTIPADIPYLSVSLDKKQYWQQKLGKKTKPRIGIVWSGSMTNKIDNNLCARRNIPLAQLQPLFELPLEFHVLQKEIRPEDQPVLESLRHLHCHQDELQDFADTAALIQEMDLVISVCTSVAHLAGALGHPTWVMLPYSADYRWMLHPTDSPWYPSLTLIRSEKIADWADVVAQTVQKLNEAF